MKVFKFCSLESFFYDNFFKVFVFFNQGLELRILWGRHSGLTLRTIKVIEDDTRSIVLFLHLTLDTVDVIDMSTLQVDTWLLSKS